ncbi:ATP-binding protein [Shimia sp. SDUM112013]|uniref:AAA family ATPase n=1 Tax=Shimia sp. SDUM112013 TaxID=3136160 RepID=UPI0032ED7205
MTGCGTLHILVGHVASGKSTLARRLAEPPATVVIAEDDWLSTLYGPEMQTLNDYVTYSARLRERMTVHVVDLLRAGLSVVLDFGANTLESRAWLHDVLKDSGCDHVLHYLDVPTETCRARLHRRNAEGRHPFKVSDAQFDRITAHFVPPKAEEGFNITVYHSD